MGYSKNWWKEREAQSEIRCQSCGIMEYSKICNERLTDYRGYSICGWCIARWQELEIKLGREVELERFKNGEQIKFPQKVED